MQLITNLFLILTQNAVFAQILGLPGLMQSAKSRRHLLLTGFLTLCFCAVNTGLLAVFRYALPEIDSAWMTVLGILLNGLTDLAVIALLALTKSEQVQRLVPQIHLSAFSSAVLGTMLKSGSVSFAAGFRFGMQTGAGYLLASLMLAAVLPVLSSEKMPASVRGWRGLLLYAGVLSLAVSAFAANAGTA